MSSATRSASPTGQRRQLRQADDRRHPARRDPVRPAARRYDTLIIDEAHERSLNIDFLLGYLKQLLPKRPDLKVIITSATLDAERFAKHFDGAPVIEVSGRLYPVEMRYRPLEEDEAGDPDLPDAIVDAVDQCAATARATCSCSCPASARSARRPSTAEAPPAGWAAGVEILPLFARQSAQEQERVFARTRAPRRARDQRRRDLADRAGHPLRRRLRPGARQALQLSQQGRDAAGRARSRARPRTSAPGAAAACRAASAFGSTTRTTSPSARRYTEPEILRSSLAGVILRMKALQAGRGPRTSPSSSRRSRA
jgi:ATP-dependent helicase HrpA